MARRPPAVESRQHPRGELSLRDLHDFSWLDGSVPIALLRWEVLALSNQLDRIDVPAA